jgi:hypothetical protein
MKHYIQKKIGRLKMSRLKIDHGIRDLIGELWEHDYETKASCEGHYGLKAYVIISKGDGWFKNNSEQYGLEFQENNECCETHTGSICCGSCGAGRNGYSVYRGKLI